MVLEGRSDGSAKIWLRGPQCIKHKPKLTLALNPDFSPLVILRCRPLRLVGSCIRCFVTFVNSFVTRVSVCNSPNYLTCMETCLFLFVFVCFCVMFTGVAGISAGCDIRRQTRLRLGKRHRLSRSHNGANILMLLH